MTVCEPKKLKGKVSEIFGGIKNPVNLYPIKIKTSLLLGSDRGDLVTAIIL